MDVKKRIRKLEETVGVEDKEPLMVVVVLQPADEATEPHFAESVREWLTYRAACDEAKRRRTSVSLFISNRFTEYEVRHGLKPGTLSKHPLKGEVPFDELLAKATGQRAENETDSDESHQPQGAGEVER